MVFKNIHKLYLVALFILPLPFILYAAPEDLDTFYDFEDVEGEGTLYIGQPPNNITVTGFTLQPIDNPALYHSGTKALILGPGQEGKIIFERGVQNLQFYAADSDGGGRIELRDRNRIQLAEQGVVEGLPTNISPGANPQLQSFVAFNTDIMVTSDLNLSLIHI